jgi:hypothetical protein
MRLDIRAASISVAIDDDETTIVKITVNDAIRAAAQDLCDGMTGDSPTRRRLGEVASGLRQTVDHGWWLRVTGATPQAQDRKAEATLAKIKAIADDERGDPNVRAVAQAMAQAKPRRKSAPGLEAFDAAVEKSRHPDNWADLLRRREQATAERRAKREAAKARRATEIASDSVATPKPPAPASNSVAAPDLKTASDSVAATPTDTSLRRPSLGERIIEHMRNAPPPPGVEATCVDCGKPVNRVLRGFGRSVSAKRCSACAVEAPRKRAAIANAERAKRRAEARAGLACATCGKPLDARRSTARFCGPTCRSKAWRA